MGAVHNLHVTEALRLYYNGYPSTMLSLFMAITGGADWQDIMEPMACIGPFYGFCFLFYISFMVLGVFSVLVGICTDRAIAASKLSQDYLVQEQKQQLKSALKA